jgi:putative flippase GtrA
MLTAKYQEAWRCCGYKVPQYFFFVTSGALCDVAQALIDYCVYLLYTSDGPERATVCWTISYTLSIVIRHSSHRLLVFGEFEGTYWSSLMRTYMTYSTSIVVSMITNHVLCSFLHFSHRVAWVVTMLWTGIYNYYALKANWKNKTPQSPAPAPPRLPVERAQSGEMIV